MGNKWKQWQILFSWAPKSLWLMTAVMKLKDTCSLFIKSYDQPRQHIKKKRLLVVDKGLYSQSYGFSSSHVWTWQWTIKAEHWRIDVFKLWCWRRLVRVPWTARRSNQSILSEISPSNEYSGLISFRIDWLNLAVQGTLKTLLQHNSSKASVLQCSTFFMVQLSNPYMTTGKPVA